MIEADKEIRLQEEAINNTLYQQWELLPIQYTVGSTTDTGPFDCVFFYADVLRSYKAKHIQVVYYSKTELKWVALPSTVDEVNGTISASIPRASTIGFILNSAWYSRFTQQLANEYPLWTHIRQSNESNGQQFLNFFGIELEEVYDWIEWTKEQKYIGTADVYQLGFAYTYDLPLYVNILNRGTDVYYITDALDHPVPEIQDMHEFFNGLTDKGYMIDVESRKLFTKRAYDPLHFIQGDIHLTLTPQLLHRWNSIDEFALLFGLERKAKESNTDLRERVLDVFRYKAGAHEMGLLYGIARELNLMKRIVWKDDSKHLHLLSSTKPLDFRTLHVDHEPISKDQYTIYPNGDVSIHALNQGKQHVVTFVCDIELHELHNKDDEELYEMMFQSDGQASLKLLKWVNQIKDVSPIMWDQFRWDVGHWDTIDKKETGLGFIPNRWDASLDPWK